MTLAEELAADLGAAIGDYEQTIEWNGANYACVRKTNPAGLGFEDGGQVDKASEWVVIARNLFTGALPQVGDAVDSNTLQIKQINPSLANLALLLGSFDEP